MGPDEEPDISFNYGWHVSAKELRQRIFPQCIRKQEITEFAEGGEADDRTVTIGYRDIDGEWQNYHDK